MARTLLSLVLLQFLFSLHFLFFFALSKLLLLLLGVVIFFVIGFLVWFGVIGVCLALYICVCVDRCNSAAVFDVFLLFYLLDL